MKTIKIVVFAIGLVLLFNCEKKKIYRYESVKSELAPFLQPKLADVFQYSDTLIIYDTTYFSRAISTLNEYKNHLEVKDSIYNNLIINRLQEIETLKIQTEQPNIYLSEQSLKANFESSDRDIEKMMRFLDGYPKQCEAAKSQLTKPNILHTQLTINQLSTLFTFISNDLTNHLKTNNVLAKYQKTLVNTQLAIKDYIAFLNSKLLNNEVK